MWAVIVLCSKLNSFFAFLFFPEIAFLKFYIGIIFRFIWTKKKNDFQYFNSKMSTIYDPIFAKTFSSFYFNIFCKFLLKSVKNLFYFGVGLGARISKSVWKFRIPQKYIPYNLYTVYYSIDRTSPVRIIVWDNRRLFGILRKLCFFFCEICKKESTTLFFRNSRRVEAVSFFLQEKDNEEYKGTSTFIVNFYRRHITSGKMRGKKRKHVVKITTVLVSPGKVIFATSVSFVWKDSQIRILLLVIF